MIYLYVEDELSEAVALKILGFIEQEENRCFGHKKAFTKKGYGDIKRNIRKYNEIAKYNPVLVLVDLDNTDCAPSKMSEFIDFPKNRNFIFRIAVREVEAWLFADRKNFAEYLGVAIARIPMQPEEIDDPKQFLFNIARRSKKKAIREDIPPEPESKARIGKNYNGRLKEFVWKHWDVQIARETLLRKSLDKAIMAISSLN